jgi:hypothetical protein
MSRRTFFLGSLILVVTVAAGAQEPAPVVEGVSPKHFRAHCERLLTALKKLDVALPPATVQELERLLAAESKEPEAFVRVAQKLLDAHCLIRVTINPESRVKAVRGPAAAELVRGRQSYLLVKVHNEAGVTHGLKVKGAQLAAEGKDDKDRWLEAEVYAVPPLGKSLSGQPVEYVLLRLTARQAGKREATLMFDVGQGTQDLGFRNEVPILFTVQQGKR